MGHAEEEEYESLSSEHGTQNTWEARERAGFLAWLKPHFLLGLLFLSILFNVLLILGWTSSRDELSAPKQPVWVGSSYRREELKLGFTKEDTMWWNTKYSGSNEREVSDLWHNEIPWENGIIAIDKQEASSLGLPESQSFPWDVTKGIYILNAHHILHCIRNLYISIEEYRYNRPQSVTYPHILHCLDSIRVETMCAADDTLRYVPLNNMSGFKPGDGQKRMCRDWHQIQSFVKKHDPCYRYVFPGDDSVSNLERFKYCPNDSPYIPKIREYFRYSDDWLPFP
ncbi:hypothetical protein F9C07_2276768 [Aspergillus flavus]|uniref:Uncharacterized protein n=1 Tax=Aspergillus flavus (strain ATCC 200026 / FGSC A1120 / IAM 13836 / NRRL 3357 / JCM 12722 / SRRC 167) TaxID=332952 RepID=A0A7U2MCT6_ASPFN|nr:hypothetical protein AFLA_012267 [Aspergillus flavus NRRL3357]KAJ1709089.1 hypothetical protein NYO67_8761 [Aspergillus flavus]QRD81324.1 hypothetical protein F9C07_2276768 [Aspergillus flavus]